MDPRDYIDFGEHYDNNFEHLNPDDMHNNENNLTSNDMEQPMHANMPLESNTQEENIDQTEVKKRKKTSEVWKHFKVCDQKLDDGTILPKAVCIYCKHALICKTTNGTGHLHRHFNACLKKNGHNHARQSQLSANTGISSFKYSQAKMRVELARFIACAELPFRFAENRCFKRFVQVALQPEFKKVSRNTNRSDVVKLYDEEKKKLINVFSNLKGSIAVTSDMWDGGNNLPFICVTAHYIDENWLLQKRIIAFRLLEFPHTGSSIFHAMMNVFKEYNITHKIFSITFDNASNNSSAIEQFKHVLHPPYGGKFFHMRCVCHIINLMVQDGLKVIQTQLQLIRDAIGYISSSSSRQQDFAHLCMSHGLKPIKLKKDIRIRWNSTYHMLKSCKGYTNVINFYYNNKMNDNLLRDEEWNVCFALVDFFKVFYDATCNCSGVYYPTSPIALHDLFSISATFAKYRFDTTCNFTNICEQMETKYKKYWTEIPYTFCFGAIMDPRIKVSGLEVILTEISRNLSISLPLTISNIQKTFNDTYLLYEKKYSVGTIATQSAPTVHLFGSSSSSTAAIFGMLASKGKQKSVISSRTEVFKYLDTEFVEFMTEEERNNFNILDWWKAHEKNFHVLSIMARDVLTTPVSTVASESAFSAGGHVLDEKRTRLTPQICEALMCLKDWEDADF
ncbi:PREDICTED: zinc finger [Prunus dulcis]|uniref:PREDICTED: zinc finger n=1 Tax=Prunus dulcis TaxID=3755 RepID=A0A5E4FG57_PRUDU|nr:hypothetical protein L3X38_012187 [Prunus dulcis]VVA26885.1 PREDICTED: zinc finger [Prunus dulcis]